MNKPFRFSVTAYEPGSGREWTETARAAEDLGYSTLFTADHYLGPGPGTEAGGRSPVGVAPLTACMAAAQVTTTLRVGCRVFCVDYHQPVVLAKELATLDFLSDGRLEVGLGAGWLAAEYEGIGIQMDSAGVRIERLGEVAELLRAFWSGEQLDLVGKHVRAVGFSGCPLPVQRPMPPLLLGGGSPKVLRLAGEVGDIVSLNFSNRGGKIGPESIATSSEAATAEKIDWVRQGAGDRFDEIELEMGAYFVDASEDHQSTARALADRFGVPVQDIVDNPHALLGSQQAIRERILELRETFGVSYINVPHRAMLDLAPVISSLAGS